MLDWAGAVFRWAAGAVVPMFVRPVAPAGLAWFLHALLVAGVAVGLYFAQPWLGLNQFINRGPLWFQPYWLPALFLLGYALCWAAVWLWAVLSPAPAAAEFPDLDAAWDEVVAALDKAGIGLADTPLFLVFGEFPAGYEVLFRGLPGGLVVAGGSPPGSPVRAFANRDGIYLAVPGASLLGTQGWVGGGDEDLPYADSFAHSVGVGASIGVDQSVGISIGGSLVGSVGVGRELHEIQRVVRQAREQRRPLTDDERDRIRELSASAGPAPAPGPPRPPGGSVLQNARLVADATARLAHVCARVAAARWPLCPVNGAVLAVPAAAADREDAARQWGLVAREDLSRASAALRLRFPVFALIGGAEELPGGAGFFQRFAADRGSQRLGKGFPLNPDVAPAAAGGEVERATGWVFGSLLPYHLFRQTRADAPADVRENAALFRFLVELRRRAPRLAALVGRAAADGEAPPVFGGCYLAVVADGEVKFAKEFFKKVEHSQAAVAWTDAAYDEDAAYRRATRLGYAALAAIWVGVAGLAVLAYTRL